MIDEPTDHVLRPIPVKTALLLVGIVAAIGVGAPLVSFFRESAWPNKEDVVLTLIAMAGAPLMIWLVFIPREIRWNDTAISVTPRVGRVRHVVWSQLEGFGHAGGLFMLRLEGADTFQIFARAYNRADWDRFIAYLVRHHPDKHNRIWLGVKPIFRTRRR